MSILHTPTDFFIESNESDTYIGFVNGNDCPTLDAFYDAISKALQLPDYFGRNLDALDEMLCDLSWLDYTVVFLVISHQDALLKNETQKLGELIELIVDLGNDNFEVVMR
jgi:RNAse (barnase) inhibitor barstar